MHGQLQVCVQLELSLSPLFDEVKLKQQSTRCNHPEAFNLTVHFPTTARGILVALTTDMDAGETKLQRFELIRHTGYW